MTISLREAIEEGAESLETAGIPDARMQSGSLLGHALGRNRTFLIAHGDDRLTESQIRQFRLLVGRRAAGEPFQYITGHQEFFKLDFQVEPAVLIPRPETEIIVEAALEVLRDDPSPFIADIGTGSGCIVISLLHELLGARAIATDLSQAALGVARRNAEKHGVLDRLKLIHADGFPPGESHEPFSLVTSNPPYIAEAEVPALQKEVRDFEPRTALISGGNGLDHIRALLRDTPRHLRDDGYFIFEIGFGQRDAVAELMDGEIWKVVEVRNDLQGIPRTFVLKRK
jgi:release factor glutamine methyltransferase